MKRKLTLDEKTFILILCWAGVSIILSLVRAEEWVREVCMYVSLFSILFVLPKEKPDDKNRKI